VIADYHMHLVDDDHPGMESETNIDGRTVSVRMRCDRGRDLERHVPGPYRVVFVCVRIPEDDQDAVSEGAHYCATPSRGVFLDQSALVHDQGVDILNVDQSSFGRGDRQPAAHRGHLAAPARAGIGWRLLSRRSQLDRLHDRVKELLEVASAFLRRLDGNGGQHAA